MESRAWEAKYANPAENLKSLGSLLQHRKKGIWSIIDIDIDIDTYIYIDILLY